MYAESCNCDHGHLNSETKHMTLIAIIEKAFIRTKKDHAVILAKKIDFTRRWQITKPDNTNNGEEDKLY